MTWNSKRCSARSRTVRESAVFLLLFFVEMFAPLRAADTTPPVPLLQGVMSPAVFEQALQRLDQAAKIGRTAYVCSVLVRIKQKRAAYALTTLARRVFFFCAHSLRSCCCSFGRRCT